MATLDLSKHVAWRGVQTTALTNTYAGVDREVVVDMQKKTLVVLSGTAGTNYPLARESRTITAGTGVDIKVGGTSVASTTLANDFTVDAKLSDIFSTGKGLKVDSTSGKAEVDITLDYVAATGVVTVYGDSAKQNALGSVTIPSHTSALSAATVETASAGSPVNGQVAGTYLHFVWNLTNGSTSNTYIDVSTLVDVYTVGDGLQTNSQDSRKFEVKAGNGLDINSSSKAVEVKVKSGEAILKNDGSAAGMYIDTAALHTETDQTIVSSASGNILTANATDSGAYLGLATNSGLELDANGKLQVVLDYGVVTE